MMLGARILTIILAVILPMILSLPAAVVILMTPTTLALLLFKTGINNTVVMIGVLKIIFGQYTVIRRCRIARHQQILIQKLLGIAPHAVVVAAAATVVVRITTTLRARLTADAAALTALHVVLLDHSKIEPSERNPL